MNDTVNDKKGHIIVNDSFARKPDGLPVLLSCDVRNYLHTIMESLINLPRSILNKLFKYGA